jgi:hypothetical protein
MPKSIVVFDEYVPAGTTAYTSDRFDAVMGMHDELSFHALIDDVSGSGSFDCWILVSADQRLWLQRNDSDQSCPPPLNPSLAAGDMHVDTLATTGVNTRVFSDACLAITRAGSVFTMGGPVPAFLRLAVQLGSAGAHVRIHYCGRGHLD